MNKSCKVTGIGFDYLFDTAAPSIPPSMGWKAQIPPSPCHITEENFVRSPDLEDDDKVTFDFFLFHDPAEGYSRDQLYQICASISSDFWYNLVGLEFKYATSGRSCRSRCYGTQLSSLEKVCFDIDGAGGEYIEKIVHFQCMGPAASVVEVKSLYPFALSSSFFSLNGVKRYFLLTFISYSFIPRKGGSYVVRVIQCGRKTCFKFFERQRGGL